ncbi:hypothetical protein BDQ17DRAFT_1349097 [Cyathus striatus]|nr:hypothetical protein BDQ17DRAFT_1349097 [Cyathus striatus]
MASNSALNLATPMSESISCNAVSSVVCSRVVSSYLKSAGLTSSKSGPEGYFPSVLNHGIISNTPSQVAYSKDLNANKGISTSVKSQKKVTMQTRVAVLERNPHRFQIIPLRDVKNYCEAWPLVSDCSNANIQTSPSLPALGLRPRELLEMESNFETGFTPQIISYTADTCTPSASDTAISSTQATPLRPIPHDRQLSMEYVFSANTCLLGSSPSDPRYDIDFVVSSCPRPRSNLRYPAGKLGFSNSRRKTLLPSTAPSSRKSSSKMNALASRYSSVTGTKGDNTKRHAIYSQSLYISKPETFANPLLFLKLQDATFLADKHASWIGSPEDRLNCNVRRSIVTGVFEHVRSSSHGTFSSMSSISSCYSQASFMAKSAVAAPLRLFKRILSKRRVILRDCKDIVAAPTKQPKLVQEMMADIDEMLREWRVDSRSEAG